MTGAEIAAIVGATAALGSGAFGAIQSEQAADKAKDLSAEAPDPVTRGDAAIQDAMRKRRAALAKGGTSDRLSLTSTRSPGQTRRPTLVGEVGS